MTDQPASVTPPSHFSVGTTNAATSSENPLFDPQEHDNERRMSEHGPKSSGPIRGRLNTCRLPGCNRPMFFDRRFNEFWEWDEVRRRFVEIVESGLASMATSIAGDLVVTSRVCLFQISSPSSNTFSCVEATRTEATRTFV